MTPKPVSSKKYLASYLYIFLLFTAVIAAFYFYLQFRDVKRQFSNLTAISPAPSAVPLASIEPIVSPSPVANTSGYLPGKNWKTVTNLPLGISVCLPPQWEFTVNNGQMSGYVIFNRDAGYQPGATDIKVYPYLGGSRREEYLTQLLQYEHDREAQRTKATVKEITINNKSFLDISVPGFAPVLVTVLGDKLYSIDRQYKNLVNDSASAYRRDIYTLAGCLKKI